MLFILYIIVDANISESLETIGQEISLGNVALIYIYNFIILIWLLYYTMYIVIFPSCGILFYYSDVHILFI